MLPEMRKIIPKRELKKLEKIFGVKNKLTSDKKSVQLSLFG